jgi:hypothetical protein
MSELMLCPDRITSHAKSRELIKRSSKSSLPEIHSADGAYQFVPNSELWNKRLTNYSRLPISLVTVRVRLLDFDPIEHIRQRLADDLE